LAFIEAERQSGRTQISADELEALIFSENRKAFTLEPTAEALVESAIVPPHLGKDVQMCTDNAVKPYDEEFVCSICLGFVTEPWVSAACCDKLFCKPCVRGVKKCPCCNTTFKCTPKVNRILKNYI